MYVYNTHMYNRCIVHLIAFISHCWTLFKQIMKSELAMAGAYDCFSQDAGRLVYLVARFSGVPP